MSQIGTILSQSLAGSEVTERVAARDVGKKKSAPVGRVRKQDEVDLKTAGPDGLDPARRLAGNAEEEAQQDKAEHPVYGKKPQPKKPKSPTLDLQG